MKRSEINKCIAEATRFFGGFQFHLPPFAAWTPADWLTRGHDADEIRNCGLGWDVTSFGSDDFLRRGLLLFTLRNGRAGDSANRKIYAEKIMMVRELQETPFHFHTQKTEDIINRGGGNLVCTLYGSTPAGEFATAPVVVWCDGVQRTVPAGGQVILSPGESITMSPGLYHQFYAQKGTGDAMIGEVSSVNDDAADNRFHVPLPRFPAIEEDQAPLRLLCNEYPPAR